jgi:hypothetical protein
MTLSVEGSPISCREHSTNEKHGRGRNYEYKLVADLKGIAGVSDKKTYF